MKNKLRCLNKLMMKVAAMILAAVTMFSSLTISAEAKTKTVDDSDRVMGYMSTEGMSVSFTWIQREISDLYPAFAVGLGDGSVLVVSTYIDTFTDYTWATGYYTFSVASCYYYAPESDSAIMLSQKGQVTNSASAYYTFAEESECAQAFGWDSLCQVGTPVEGEEVVIQYYKKNSDKLVQETTTIKKMNDDGTLELKDIPNGTCPMAILDADNPKVAYGYVGLEYGSTKKFARSFLSNTEEFYYGGKEVLNQDVLFGNMQYSAKKEEIVKASGKAKNDCVEAYKATDRMGQIIGFDSIGNLIYHTSAVAFETVSGQPFVISAYGDNNAFRQFDFYYETCERTRIPLDFYGYYTDEKFAVWGPQSDSDEKALRKSKSFTTLAKTYENEYVRTVIMYDEGNQERYIEEAPGMIYDLYSDGSMAVAFNLEGNVSADGMYIFLDAGDNDLLVGIAMPGGENYSLSMDEEYFSSKTEERSTSEAFENVKDPTLKRASDAVEGNPSHFGAVYVYDENENDIGTKFAFAYTENNETYILSNSMDVTDEDMSTYRAEYIPLSENNTPIAITYDKKMYLCNMIRWKIANNSDIDRLIDNGTIFTKEVPVPNQEVKVVYVDSEERIAKEYLTEAVIYSNSALTLDKHPENAMYPYLIMDAEDESILVGFAYEDNRIILDYDNNYVQKMEADQDRLYSDAEMYYDNGNKDLKDDCFTRIVSTSSSGTGLESSSFVLDTKLGRQAITNDYNGDWFHWGKSIVLDKDMYSVSGDTVSNGGTLKSWNLDGPTDPKGKVLTSKYDNIAYTAKPAYFGEKVNVIYFTKEDDADAKQGKFKNIELGDCTIDGVLTIVGEVAIENQLGNAIIVDAANNGYIVGYIGTDGIAHSMYRNRELYYTYKDSEKNITSIISDDKSVLSDEVANEDSKSHKSSGGAGGVIVFIILVAAVVVFILWKKGIISFRR